MTVAALAVIGGGIALGWPALVAIGAAPIIVSLLPCAAMCAMGLCMMGKGSQTASAMDAQEDALSQPHSLPALGYTPKLAYAPIVQSEAIRDNARATAR